MNIQDIYNSMLDLHEGVRVRRLKSILKTDQLKNEWYQGLPFKIIHTLLQRESIHLKVLKPLLKTGLILKYRAVGPFTVVKLAQHLKMGIPKPADCGPYGKILERQIAKAERSL